VPWKRRPVVRAAYLLTYLFFFVAGIFAFFYPAQAILDALKSSLTYAWAGFLTVGGGLAMWSPLRNTWSGELIGLPLLSASHMIFGLALLGFGKTAAAIAVGLVFCGIGSGFIGRWLEIRGKAKMLRGVGNGSADS